jgi:hypothetical protein
MERYDARHAPDSAEWLALDEGERLDLVMAYHRRAKIKLPNPRMHAVIHTVVENQIAGGGETPVRPTLERLQAEGLDRHEAVHAIGSVLAEHIYDLVKKNAPPGEPTVRYYGVLQNLTAESWRRAR